VVRNFPAAGSTRTAILLGYAVNELAADVRAALLQKLADSTRAGVPLLIVEAIALRDKAWWPEWTSRLGKEGAGADEWRFPAALPEMLREMARSAGLD